MTPGFSLKTRLLAGLMLATVLVWTGLAASSYIASRQQLDELMDANLQQAGELLAAQLTEGDDRDEIELEHVRQLHHYDRSLAFQVWENGVRLRLRAASTPAQRLSSVESGFSLNTVQGQSWRVYSTWAGRRQALVQVGEPVSARDRVSREITTRLLTPLVLALPFLALALTLAIRRGLHPLAVLAAQVSALEPACLEPLAAQAAPIEVRPLLEQLNHLFDRMRQSLENERRFTADAAHELRTPIAAIAIQAQVAQGAKEGVEQRRALDQVLRGCERCTHLVEQLLTVARADNARRSQVQTFCDLALAARAALAELGPMAHDKDVCLELSGPDQMLVSGDASWLQILLRNLVDNAIRYGSPGGSVHVSLETRADGVLLQVIDDGPGIPAQDRSRVMERFVRIAGSGESGSGLGLSIVSRIAQTCGARLSLAEGQGGKGLRVKLLFAREPGPSTR